jgi:hypothetical protein
MAEFALALRRRQNPALRSPAPIAQAQRRRGTLQWSLRYEFYACSDLPLDIDRIAKRVDAFQHLYSNSRPHAALAGMISANYLSIRRAKETPPSHMS